MILNQKFYGEFKERLTTTDAVFIITDGDASAIFVRVPVAKGVEAVYASREYNADKEPDVTPFGKKMDFFGLSFIAKNLGEENGRSNGAALKDLFFAESSSIGRQVWGGPTPLSMDGLREEFLQLVNAAVEAYVTKNASSLKARADEHINREVERCSYYVSEEVMRRFYAYGAPKAMETNFSEVSLIRLAAYLSQGDEAIQRFAKEYVEDNAERFIVSLLLNDQVDAEYAKFNENPPQKAVLIRDIVRSMEDVKDAKTVNLTIVNKQGEKMEVKYPADALRRVSGVDIVNFDYTGHNLTGAKRKELKAFFSKDGRTWSCEDDILPEDIIEIAYKKKVVFQRKEAG